MSTHLGKILGELNRARGIDLGGYRRDMLERRLAARTGQVGKVDAEAYIERLRNDPDECNRLIDTITIKVSSFFRDPIVFEFLAQEVLPEIVRRKRRRCSRELRVWCAGCAGGEEAIRFSLTSFSLRGIVFLSQLESTSP